MSRLWIPALLAGFAGGCQQPACQCHEPRSPNAVGHSENPPKGAAVSAPVTTNPDAAAAPAAQALPEVVVRNIGLHIGGGPNDDATRAPLLRAVEAHFDELRSCYRKIGEPGKGGAFGVDLSIPREGGRAEVRNPRTGLSGPQFRECVIGVFSKIEFERPPRGPTVISYSLEYSLE